MSRFRSHGGQGRHEEEEKQEGKEVWYAGVRQRASCAPSDFAPAPTAEVAPEEEDIEQPRGPKTGEVLPIFVLASPELIARGRAGCYCPRNCAEYNSCMKENHDRVVGVCCIGWVIIILYAVFFVF